MATRYDFEPCDGDSGECRARMTPDPMGDYVAVEEYDKLERKLKALCRGVVRDLSGRTAAERSVWFRAMRDAVPPISGGE